MKILEPRWKSYTITTAEPLLTPPQCDELIRIGQSEPKVKARTGIRKLNLKYRNSIISCIPLVKAAPIYEVIKRWLAVTNNNYFGFDTVQLSEQAQYAEYSKGQFYDWHMDSAIEMAAMPAVRKISMTLALNDPKDFEGGDLEIYRGGTLDSEENKFKLKQGYAVFFASFLLHRVTPVTKGNRKSLVMWFGGSSLR